jgi:nickel-dependent lactate racemase
LRLGEIVLFAPHIREFHCRPDMDAAIRAVGYHGRDYVRAYCEQHPSFNRNIAAHVINVRGLGEWKEGREAFDFRVTLASAIPREDCRGGRPGLS